MDRIFDAYCAPCGDPVGHLLLDPGSVRCSGCGQVQLLVAPLA